MKTLFLCVDRDDDLGRKAAVETPVVGRRRVLDAATQLGLADPEDSDTNAILSAIHLYDKDLARNKEGRQMEVAVIAGHRIVGIRSDRELARQLATVMDLTEADEIVLVTDGAEDEQILPILQHRAPVVHMHRAIVKQAPRLEGAWYVLQRMLDDDKLAKRYVLPLGLVILIWGLAFLFGLSGIATGLTLTIIGGWLFVHSMRWEERVSQFFGDFYEGLRTGKVGLVGNVVMLALLIGGAGSAADKTTLANGWSYATVKFLSEFLFWFVSALLVRTAGNLIDEVLREGKASVRHWTFAFTMISFGFIGGAILDASVALMDGTGIGDVLDFRIVVRLMVGLAIMASGIVLTRYARNFFRDELAPRSG